MEERRDHGLQARFIGNQEEQALVAAITKEGPLRDRVLIVLLLHTGLRAMESCHLRRDQVKLGKNHVHDFLDTVTLYT